MLKPRNLLILFFLILSFSWFNSSGIWKRTRAIYFNSPGKKRTISNSTFGALKIKAEEAKTFIKTKSYNDEICFLLDMSLPSGQNRFFVYDLKKDAIQNSGVVTHGNCNQSWFEGRKYSNDVGCGCTSLGKYKVGYAYNGKFGLAYKLYGLDKTNSNAFIRYVVLHSHSCVPETEVSDDICQSNGCPTISPGFLQQLKPMIDKSSRPILMWIY